MWQEDYRAQQIGATWTAEFLPLTVREERWAIPRAPLQPENEAELPAGVTVQLGAQGLLSHEFLTERRTVSLCDCTPSGSPAGRRPWTAGRSMCGPPAASAW